MDLADLQQGQAILRQNSPNDTSANIFEFFKQRSDKHAKLIETLINIMDQSIPSVLTKITLSLFDSQRKDVGRMLKELTLLKI